MIIRPHRPQCQRNEVRGVGRGITDEEEQDISARDFAAFCRVIAHDPSISIA